MSCRHSPIDGTPTTATTLQHCPYITQYGDQSQMACSVTALQSPGHSRERSQLSVHSVWLVMHTSGFPRSLLLMTQPSALPGTSPDTIDSPRPLTTSAYTWTGSRTWCFH